MSLCELAGPMPRSVSNPWSATSHVATLPAVSEMDVLGAASAARAEDRELMARLMAGEQAALAEVYERYGGLVFAMARRVLYDDALAEDVTQEVFAYVWQQPERFD